jgi:lycopene cyclase domain-containing protein
MTYFGFLAIFLFIPIIIFLLMAWNDSRRGRLISGFKNGRAVWMAIFLHMVVAVVYTTPWDNYLVATGVWYYNPELVTGVLIGYVPIEEYTFFVVETLLAGLWWWYLARRNTVSGLYTSSWRIRLFSTVVLALLWTAALGYLIGGWPPATYLAITLVWALPPIGLQLIFGADILWRHIRLVLLTIIPMTIYLSAADSLAITSGTWTIDPDQSTGLFLGSLPIEEAIFFLLTNVLIGFGITLLLADESEKRLAESRAKIWKEKKT